MLDGPTQLVVIEGGEGSGKTTLAAQFALQKDTRTFSLFVSGISALSRSPEYLLYVLCDQIHWYFHGVRMTQTLNPETFIRTARLELAKHATREGQPFYFVIDGLLQSADTDQGLLRLILTDYLPLGIPGFKFVLTGESVRLPDAIRRKVPYKLFTPPGFSPEETKTVLSDLAIEGDIISEIATTFRGVPGKIASVRRALLGGATSADFQNRIPQTLRELYELEWNRAPLSDTELRNILAILAHSKHDLTVSSVAGILHIPVTTVRDKVGNLQFVKIAESGEISFVSPSFQLFAANVLTSSKEDALQRILDYLSRASLSNEAVEHLPTYFAVLGRDKDLVSYLCPEHLCAVCDKFHSLQPLVTSLRDGVSAAQRADIPVSLLQFSFQLGMIADLGRASALTSEIAARLALGEDNAAITLAQGAILKEDRLEGLAAVVRAQAKRGIRPDPAVLAEVRSLALDTSYSGSPWRAVSVASNIIGVLPDVAIPILEAATKGNSELPMDVALATVSLAAKDLAREHAEGDHSPEAISSRIQNPSIRGMTAALAVMIGDYRVDSLLRQCDQLASNKDRFYLLERWTATNPDHLEAHKVVSYAMDLLVKTSDYTADAITVRRIATPLPYIAEPMPRIANRLLQMIDAQLLMLEKKGPSVDYVRLCMILVETEAAWYPDQALSRLERLCYFAANLALDLRVEAYARILAVLTRDRYGRLSRMRDTLSDTITEDLKAAVKTLVGATAEHFEVLRRAVRALGAALPDTLQVIIASVNTQERRDALLGEALAAAARNARNASNIPAPRLIESTLAEIRDQGRRDRALSDFLDHFDAPAFSGLAPEWVSLLERSLGISKAAMRAIACAHSASICARNSQIQEFAKMAPSFLSKTEAAVRSIDSDWERTDLGFTIAEILSNSDETRSRKFIEVAHEDRRASRIPDDRTANSYILSVELTIRAFAGLVPQQLNIDESFVRLRRLIEHVPSHGERARLWAELATRCFARGSSTLGMKVVDECVRPLIKAIDDGGFGEVVVVDAAPCLYCAHPVTAIRDISALDLRHKDRAFERISWYYLLRQPPEEPVALTNSAIERIERSDVDNIIECLQHIDTDHVFASVVSRLCHSLNSEEGKNAFSKGERAEFARRIQELARSKLPWPLGIQHNGYSVLVSSYLMAIQQANESNWREVAVGADRIPNIADRCFVLSELVDLIPSRFDSLRMECAEKAQAYANSIPAPLDRMEHLRSLAAVVRSISPPMAKQCLRDALQISLNAEEDLGNEQRAIIDLADRLGEDFTKSLISDMENDPAILSRRKAPAVRRSEVNNIMRRFPSRVTVSEVEALKDETAAELCWSMLAGLNAGTVAYCSVDKTAPLLARASQMSLAHAYPIFAWAIQNSVVCHSKTPFGTRHLVQLFEACAAACEFGIRLSSRRIGYQRISLEPLTSPDQSEAVEIGAGEREKAVQFIREWLTENKSQQLIISDPYFGPSDLELIRIILEAQPSCTVEVLAGEKKQRDLGLNPPYDQEYQQQWRTISRHDPPDTRIVVVGFAAGLDSPVHERYIIGDSCGLELGISFSGLGRNKVSKISRLSPEVASAQRSTLEPFLACRLREQNRQRLRYTSFTL
jgi:hypothetical protein